MPGVVVGVVNVASLSVKSVGAGPATNGTLTRCKVGSDGYIVSSVSELASKGNAKPTVGASSAPTDCASNVSSVSTGTAPRPPLFLHKLSTHLPKEKSRYAPALQWFARMLYPLMYNRPQRYVGVNRSSLRRLPLRRRRLKLPPLTETPLTRPVTLNKALK